MEAINRKNLCAKCLEKLAESANMFGYHKIEALALLGLNADYLNPTCASCFTPVKIIYDVKIS